jgi:hypothetical protein
MACSKFALAYPGFAEYLVVEELHVCPTDTQKALLNLKVHYTR